jgi:hypothetical protein
MSVKLKKDLGLKDYLDLIAKQNEAIIDQLMIDPNAMTSAFRLTSHKQYKDSIKKYTIAQEIDKPKIEEKIGLNLDKNPTKSEGSPPPDNIGVVIGIVIAIIILFLIVILLQQ